MLDYNIILPSDPVVITDILTLSQKPLSVVIITVPRIHWTGNYNGPAYYVIYATRCDYWMGNSSATRYG